MTWTQTETTSGPVAVTPPAYTEARVARIIWVGKSAGVPYQPELPDVVKCWWDEWVPVAALINDAGDWFYGRVDGKRLSYFDVNEDDLSGFLRHLDEVEDAFDKHGVLSDVHRPIQVRVLLGLDAGGWPVWHYPGRDEA